jgi:hypothetical protein
MAPLLFSCGPLLGIGPRERQVVVFRAYPLPEFFLYLEYWETTQEEILTLLEAPDAIMDGPKLREFEAKPDEIWFYYPSKREIVYKVTLVDGEGGLYDLKFAPSNGLYLALWFKKGRLIWVTGS